MTFLSLPKKIGYKFKDSSLLEEALTHSSISSFENRNNERLEFLGDRVLGLVVATMLIEKFPTEKEGNLAKRLSFLVSKPSLKNVAEQIQLGDFIKMSTSESSSGGRKNSSILADGCEALIGAIYIDGGLKSASIFIKKYWEKMLIKGENPPVDAKTYLQEKIQSKGLPAPLYKIVSRKGEDHKPIFEVEVMVEGLENQKGTGCSKRKAEQNAASLMLEKLL